MCALPVSLPGDGGGGDGSSGSSEEGGSGGGVATVPLAVPAAHQIPYDMLRGLGIVGSSGAEGEGEGGATAGAGLPGFSRSGFSRHKEVRPVEVWWSYSRIEELAFHYIIFIILLIIIIMRLA